MFGGYDLYTSYSDIWQFDTDLLTWTQIADFIPGARPGGSLGAPPGDLVVSPGDEAYPAPRYLHSVVVEGSSMCVIGQFFDFYCRQLVN